MMLKDKRAIVTGGSLGIGAAIGKNLIGMAPEPVVAKVVLLFFGRPSPV